MIVGDRARTQQDYNVMCDDTNTRSNALPLVVPTLNDITVTACKPVSVTELTLEQGGPSYLTTSQNNRVFVPPSSDPPSIQQRLLQQSCLHHSHQGQKTTESVRGMRVTTRRR